MTRFVHQRHKPPTPLDRERELVVVCAPLRSNVNLSRLVRTASCCGVRRMIACGRAKIDPEIARVDPSELVEVHRSLPPVLSKLKAEGFQLVGLEQATNSENLYEVQFQRRMALVVGNERTGLDDETLRLMDRVVEIPVYGLPFSYNVSTAASFALYEYCRQFPRG